MPLVRGKYSATSWIPKVTGNKANVNQSNLPVRTNAEYLGLGAITTALGGRKRVEAIWEIASANFGYKAPTVGEPSV